MRPETCFNTFSIQRCVASTSTSALHSCSWAKARSSVCLCSAGSSASSELFLHDLGTSLVVLIKSVVVAPLGTDDAGSDLGELALLLLDAATKLGQALLMGGERSASHFSISPR